MKALLAADDPRLLDEVERLLERFPLPAGSELQVLTVVDDVYGLVRELGGETFGAAGFYDQIQQQALEQARSLLDGVSGRFSGQDYSITTKLLEGAPSAEIVGCAKAEGADLVIVGSHGMDRIERALIGSVAFHVLGHTEQEVLIVRPPAPTKPDPGTGSPSILFADDGSAFADDGVRFLRRLASQRCDAHVTASAVMPLIKLYRMDLKAHLSESWRLKCRARRASLERRCEEIRSLGFECDSLLSPRTRMWEEPSSIRRCSHRRR